jgi:hypothetical protein
MKITRLSRQREMNRNGNERLERRFFILSESKKEGQAEMDEQK